MRTTIATALLLLAQRAAALKIVVAGGTGGVGSAIAGRLAAKGHAVTILCRNAYLAVTPSRVSEDFGWVGEKRLDKWADKGVAVAFRDWTGGDELDSVSDRWVGWEDAVADADGVVCCVGDLGRDGRRRPMDALFRAAAEAGAKAPEKFVLLQPVDALVATQNFAEKKMETLRLCEASWLKSYGSKGVCLRAGTVLGLPKFADSRLFPAPKDYGVRGDWVHIEDLADYVAAAVDPKIPGGMALQVRPQAVPTLDDARAKRPSSNYYE